MSKSKSKQIIARSYSGESVGITYANQEKIALNLRKLRFESEIKQAGYPQDMAAAINQFIQVRADMIENRYEQVMLYIYVQQFGSFWQDFGCKSIDEWLAKFDLPTGSTLATREIMVRLFSRDTFILLGDEILGEMMYLVSRFQKDPEQKKADYQRIFDAYCKINDSFDKTEFRKIVNWYVNTNYASKTIEVEDVKARPPRQLPKGMQAVKVARPITEIVNESPAVPANQADASSIDDDVDVESLPDSAMDVVIEHRLCAGCRARDAYISQLRRVIVTEIGLNRVPERPRDI
jgi:hypothetical protein